MNTPLDDKSALLEKYTGCMLGLAIGDALGMPVEGLSEDKIRDIYGEIQELRDCGSWKKGSITDDTQQSMLIAQHLIAHGGKIKPEALATEFLTYYQSGYARALGSTFSSACERLAQGISCERSGAPEISEEFSLGCGSAMRVAPVGLASKTLEEAIDNARFSSLPTHAHPETIAGAAVIAAGVFSLKYENPLEEFPTRHFWESIRTAMYAFDAPLLQQKLEAIQKNTLQGKKLEWYYIQNILGTSGKVTAVVPSALALFLSSPHDFKRTVIDAVNLGGDTDSRASIAGALSGAYLGKEALPAAWIEQVEYTEELQELGKQLFNGYSI